MILASRCVSVNNSGQIISIFQSAAVLTGVKHGLGKSVEDIGSNDLVQLQKVNWRLFWP